MLRTERVTQQSMRP